VARQRQGKRSSSPLGSTETTGFLGENTQDESNHYVSRTHCCCNPLRTTPRYFITVNAKNMAERASGQSSAVVRDQIGASLDDESNDRIQSTVRLNQCSLSNCWPFYNNWINLIEILLQNGVSHPNDLLFQRTIYQ
jgi:hypothetical protein